MLVNSYLVQGEIVFIDALNRKNLPFEYSLDIGITWEANDVSSHANVLMGHIKKTISIRISNNFNIRKSDIKTIRFSLLSLIDTYDTLKNLENF